jgi:hypothetical protein
VRAALTAHTIALPIVNVFAAFLLGNDWRMSCSTAMRSTRMTWFLERGTDLLVCEIRRGDDLTYEFEIAAATGKPNTKRFLSPTDLINTYLREQSQLRALGWRPRGAEVDVIY